MTTFLLVRHAAHDLLGKVLAGRAPGVHLNTQGKLEAKLLADRLAKLPIRAIYTGPLERAQETAAPLSSHLMLQISPTPAFDEVDFGVWTSLSFAVLEQRSDWKQWNQFRNRATPPDGESIQRVQDRAIKELQLLTRSYPSETVAIVTHGEVIKTMLMHFLGLSSEFHWRLDISPGSLSILTLNNGEPQVKSVNDMGHLSVITASIFN
jgi:broad specificity phosphatase PhoE